jgi:hypothetical protein
MWVYLVCFLLGMFTGGMVTLIAYDCFIVGRRSDGYVDDEGSEE